MSKIRKIVFGVVMCSVAASSPAAELVTQLNVHAKRIGTHSGNIFYINLEEAFTRPCKYGNAYCLITNAESCKSMLSIALTAKATNKPLADFRYNYDDVTQMCEVWLVSTD